MAGDVEDYQAAVRAAALCGHMLLQHDIPALLRAIARADALGPVLDPTLWLKKREDMAADRELLLAADALRAVLLRRVEASRSQIAGEGEAQ